MALANDEYIIDNIILIEEIESRPPLYDRTLMEYNDINYKKELWENVTKKVLDGVWETLTADQKIQAVFQIQKRWKNIKACFSRELRIQKITKSDPSAQKRRKYLYYDKLWFLLSSTETGETNATPRRIDNTFKEDLLDIKVSPATSLSTEVTSDAEDDTRYEKNCENVQTQPAKVIDVATDAKIIDQETNFALSLVPMLKALPQAQKLDAQIQILQIFKDIQVPSPTRSHKRTHHKHKS